MQQQRLVIIFNIPRYKHTHTQFRKILKRQERELERENEMKIKRKDSLKFALQIFPFSLLSFLVNFYIFLFIMEYNEIN